MSDVIESDVIEYEINYELLTLSTLKLFNTHEDKIYNAFIEFGIESTDDISWLISLFSNLGMNHSHIGELPSQICEPTPIRLIKKYGLPEILDASIYTTKSFSKKFKGLGKLHYLGMAGMSIFMARDYLVKSDYDEFLGLLTVSMYAFDKYNDDSLKGKIFAHRRHKETYSLKADAIKYWKENIEPNLSNDKAADLLIKVVPLSHRKLSQYVAEAKRENIHSAS